MARLQVGPTVVVDRESPGGGVNNALATEFTWRQPRARPPGSTPALDSRAAEAPPDKAPGKPRYNISATALARALPTDTGSIAFSPDSPGAHVPAAGSPPPSVRQPPRTAQGADGGGDDDSASRQPGGAPTGGDDDAAAPSRGGGGGHPSRGYSNAVPFVRRGSRAPGGPAASPGAPPPPPPPGGQLNCCSDWLFRLFLPVRCVSSSALCFFPAIITALALLLAIRSWSLLIHRHLQSPVMPGCVVARGCWQFGQGRLVRCHSR